jgi:hypothetical protein
VNAPQPPRGHARDPGEKERDELSLRMRPRAIIAAVVVVMVALEVAVLLLDYHVNYARFTEIGGLRRMCNITREDGVASWLAVTQTTLVAATLWLMVAVTRSRGRRRLVVAGWVVMALFFSYMSLDDGSKLHERVGSAVVEISERPPPEGEPTSWLTELVELFPSYGWQLVFLPAFGAMGLFTLVFLWSELALPAERRLVVVAIGLFVLAVGLDFIEGLEEDHAWNAYTWIAQDNAALERFAQDRFGRDAYTALRHFSKAIEECLEMLANTLLWAAFLGHLFREAGSAVTLRIGAPGETDREVATGAA